MHSSASPHNRSIKRLKLHLLPSASSHRLPVFDSNFKKRQVIQYTLTPTHNYYCFKETRSSGSGSHFSRCAQSIYSSATPHDWCVKRLNDVLLSLLFLEYMFIWLRLSLQSMRSEYVLFCVSSRLKLQAAQWNASLSIAFNSQIVAPWLLLFPLLSNFLSISADYRLFALLQAFARGLAQNLA